MRDAWLGELTKIATVRQQWLGLVFATLAIPVTSLLVAASGGLGSGDTITAGAATGSVVGLLAFGSWAAALAAGEYSRQTVVVSMAVVPRRSIFYGSKLAAVVCAAAAGALVSVAVACAAVWAVTPRGAHHFGDPARLFSVVVTVAAIAGIGVAIGFLGRSSTGSIAAIFALVLLPQAAGGLLGGLQPWIVGASPGAVITQAVGNTQLAVDQSYPSGPLAALATLLAVAVGLAAGGAFALHRRDG